MGLFDKIKELKLDTSYDKAKTLTVIPLGIFLFAVAYTVLMALIGFGGILEGILLIVASIPAAITALVGVIYAGKAKHEGYTDVGKYVVIGIVDILLWSSIIGFIVLAISSGA